MNPEKADVVMARKSANGARPLSYLALSDRLAYRAAVSVIETDLGAPSRSDEEYGAFVQSPLAIDRCRYVLKTDIAAFYQYIDHERLVDEVVAQTGDDLAVSFAVGLLQATSLRRFGLPQMTKPSDVLAEAYIEPMRRKLVRDGFSAFRFADDFRVACRSYAEGLRALEAAERAALDLGLVLNETKTTMPRLSTYERVLGEVERAERETFAHVEAEGEEFEIDLGYGGESDTFDDQAPSTFGEGGAGVADDEVDPDEGGADEEPVHEAQLAAARAVFGAWSDPVGAEIGGDWSAHTITTLLRKAIRVFSRAQDGWALDQVTALLVNEPHLTPQVCGYLRSIMAVDRRAVVRILDRICRRGIVSVWQAVWISYCAGEVRRTGLTKTDQPHLVWLRDQADSEHPALAAEAVLALARRRAIEGEHATRVLARAPVVHRPTLVIALALLEGERSAAVGENLVERWQAEWALQNLA